MPVDDHLETMFRADEEAYAAQDRFFAEGTDDERIEALKRAIASTDDVAQPRARLRRIAVLCAKVPGPDMADSLIDLLDRPDPMVQEAAYGGLMDAGYERYAEVARAIDRALESGRSGRAMEVLPFVVAEIGEPSALSILRRFLAHPDADVVASGVEGCAELEDPEAIPYLEPLLDDDRRVVDDPTEGTTTTIGELATQVIEELGFDPDDEDG